MDDNFTLEKYYQVLKDKNKLENVDDLKYEFLRLKTFLKWPNASPVFPVRLAAAGFYYNGENDTATCFICKESKSGWQAEDIPFEIHKSLSPDCPYVVDTERENIAPVLPDDWQLPTVFDKIKNLFSQNEDLTGRSLTSSGQNPAGIQEHENEPGSLKSGSSSDSGSFSDRIQAERGTAIPASATVADKSTVFHGTSSTPSIGDQLGPSLSSMSSAGSSGSYTQPKLPQSGELGYNTVSSGGSQPAPARSRNDNTGTPNVPQGSRSTSTSATRGSEVVPPIARPNDTRTSSVSGGQSRSASARRQSPIMTSTSTSGTSGGQFDNFGLLGDREPGPLKYERNRLESFRLWPPAANVSPPDLAKSGFFYTGQGDKVQCVFCRGILRNWDPGDIPHVEHRKSFARCPFLLGTNCGNIPMSADQSNVPAVSRGSHLLNQGSSSMESLGISTERPKHPNFAIEGNRITTFSNSNWPRYKHQTPKLLAQAGFFYAGFGDNVKCFFCDGGLKNWEPGDDPWEEHTRWFPRCPFVRSVKGERYIEQVQNKYNAGGSESTGENVMAPPGSSVATARPGHIIEEREIKARLETPLVMTVLGTGVSRQAVMVAIERRLIETGDDYPNAQALMDKVLELQESGDLTSSIVQRNASPNQNTQEPPAQEPSTRQDPSSGTGSLPGPGSSVGPSSGPGPASGGPTSGVGPSTGSSVGESGELEKENRLLKEQKTCKICLDNEVGVVFLPCGHLCCCVTCAPAVTNCPICRSEIRGSVRTYIP